MPKIPNPILVRKTKTAEALRMADYAALWGSTKDEGPLFYNVGSVVNGELDWASTDWIRFEDAIRRLINSSDAIRRLINSPVVPNPQFSIDYKDLKRLIMLRDWAYRCATIAKRESDKRMTRAAYRDS